MGGPPVLTVTVWTVVTALLSFGSPTAAVLDTGLHLPGMVGDPRIGFDALIGQHRAAAVDELTCYHYNSTICAEAKRHGSLRGCKEYSNPYVVCGAKDRACFAFTDRANASNVLAAGCWRVTPACMETECRMTEGSHFCCCNESRCNVDPQAASTTSPDQPSSTTQAGHQNGTTVGPPVGGSSGATKDAFDIKDSAILVAMLFVIILGCLGGGCWWHRKRKGRGSRGGQEVVPNVFKSDHEELPPLHLLEVRAQGRFGSVWRATHTDAVVAVKISALQDKQSWTTECQIYSLPGMIGHDNILRFIGAEQKGEDLNTDLWLVTDFHEHGSLHDYLKGHSLDWPTMLRVLHGMVRGVAHLHQEIRFPPNKSGVSAVKPSVAHRDFKSKNVLLKADLTPCIADFGLSMTLSTRCALGESHGQVGTCRYMAPEVLEGAIEFTKDSFLRIDMYACGLVMWEVLSRTRSSSGCVKEYCLPFDLELGPHQRLDEMQDIVVARKIRPEIVGGEGYPGLSSLSTTIEECWDQDAEARLPAGCVLDRLDTLMREYKERGEGDGPAVMAEDRVGGDSSEDLCAANNQYNIQLKDYTHAQVTDDSIEERAPLVIRMDLQ